MEKPIASYGNRKSALISKLTVPQIRKNSSIIMLCTCVSSRYFDENNKFQKKNKILMTKIKFSYK